jgi:hypothetical protein
MSIPSRHELPRLLRSLRIVIGPIALALCGCSGAIGDPAGDRNGSPGGETTGGQPTGGGQGGPTVDCTAISPGQALVRRLTTYEFNNTVRDLLGDKTSPGTELPPQVDSADNIFGNDAAEQAPSALLIEKYQTVAESISARATADSAGLASLNSCAANVAPANEESCARSIAASLLPRAYRREVANTEIDELVSLYKSVRALSPTVTFGSGVGAMIEAMLQAPEFLYRVEQGIPVSGNSAVRRIVGREMATRLSYLFWQTMPDAALFQAADMGELDTDDGVLAQGKKMFDDNRSHSMVGFFFDNLLPIADLNSLTRNATLFPNWSSALGVSMRQEVQSLLEFEIYQNTQAAGPYQPGSWPAVLTAPYTFVNESLFKYYGPSAFAAGTTVTGTGFVKVNLNTEQRLGLMTSGGMMAGLTISDLPSPVKRGAFIVNKLMCKGLHVPVGLNPKAPDPYSGKTARERFSKHEAMALCAACHKSIDPMGLPFETFDAVGLYRTVEHWTDPNTGMSYDTPIDASGSVPGVDGTANNAVELVKLLATSPDIGGCFAKQWMSFGYGRAIDEYADACNTQSVGTDFSKSGYNVKQLLLALTQSNGFLYRPVQ